MKWSSVLQERLDGIRSERAARERGEDPRAVIPTGLREFDKRAGHKRKLLHIYAAATGEGKGQWKLHLARAAAMAGYRVTSIEMEDPAERVADRDFAVATGINSARMMSGDLTDKEVTQIEMAMADAEDWADNVEFFAGVRTPEEAIEIFQEHPSDLSLLDYLSAFPHGRHGRERAISDFCWQWTKLLQETNSAGVAFAQLNGEVSNRGMRMYESARRRDERIVYVDGFRGFDANDLAWCTDAGRTAKELGFMFRPGRYHKRLDPNTKVRDDVMEFSFPKRNFGSEGLIRVGFDAKTSRFFDLDTKGN